MASCKLTLKRPKSVPPTITTRSFKNFNTEAFCKDISETPLDTVSIFNYIDDQVSSFNKLFLDILDQHAPIKSCKAKHKKSHVITGEIRELISKRVSLKYACMTINPTDWEANSLTSEQLSLNMLKRKLPLICPTNHQYGNLFVDVSTRMVVPTYSTLGKL